MSDKPHRKRRREVINQLRDGMLSPPEPINTVRNEFAYGQWSCTGTTEHKVELKRRDGMTYFECNCSKGTTKCRHITSVVLSICLDYAKRCDMETETKDDIASLISSFDQMDLEKPIKTNRDAEQFEWKGFDVCVPKGVNPFNLEKL